MSTELTEKDYVFKNAPPVGAEVFSALIHPDDRNKKPWCDIRKDKAAYIAFIMGYAECGTYAGAAREAHIPVSQVHDRLKDWPEFAQDVETAREYYVASLHKHVHDRAVNGVEEPVYYRGKVVGHVTKRSDQLLMFLMKRHDAAFKEKQHIETSVNVGVMVVPSQSVSEDQWSKQYERED